MKLHPKEYYEEKKQKVFKFQEGISETKDYDLQEALDGISKQNKVKFDESVEFL